LGLGLRLRLGLGLGLGSPPRSPAVAHLLHLPYISPTSPLHLRYISATSPLHLPYISTSSLASRRASVASLCQCSSCATRSAHLWGGYRGDAGEMLGRCRGDMGLAVPELSGWVSPDQVSPGQPQGGSPRAGQSCATRWAHQGRSRVRARVRIRGRGRAPNPNASPLGCMRPNPIPNPHRPSASDWKRRQRLSSVFAAAWSGLGLGLG
jgi:hypothetical protein